MKLKLNAIVHEKGAAGVIGEVVDCKDAKLAQKLLDRKCAEKVEPQGGEEKAEKKTPQGGEEK